MNNDELMNEAMRIYLQFCYPHILYNTDTGIVQMEYIWVSSAAEEMYNSLLEMVQQNFTELRKRENSRFY